MQGCDWPIRLRTMAHCLGARKANDDSVPIFHGAILVSMSLQDEGRAGPRICPLGLMCEICGSVVC
jgi:hypothetical protein